jgi:hypothetical protein
MKMRAKAESKKRRLRPEGTVPLTIHVSIPVHRQFKAIGVLRGLTMNEMVLGMIGNFVERNQRGIKVH